MTSKPLAWFKVNPQVRKHFDEAALRRLGDSLKNKQLQPVLCQPDGTLIAGERRYRAAQLVGLETLEVKIAEEMLSEPQIKLWQLTENMQRADLTGYEKWRGCAELLSLNPDWHLKELAEHLHLDPSMVTRLLSPSKCILGWQQALLAGRVGISDCYAASKLPPGEQAAMLTLKMAGANRETLEKEGRKKRGGDVPVAKVDRVKCALPGGASVVVSGTRMSLDEVIESLSFAAEYAKRAKKDGLDAKTWSVVMKQKAKLHDDPAESAAAGGQ